jgi:hypothetical protein
MTGLSPARREPWGGSDLLGLITFAIIGLAALGFAITQARSEVGVEEQELWLDVGIGALTFGAVGNAMFLLQGRRRVAVRLRRLLESPPGAVVLRAVPTVDESPRPNDQSAPGGPLVSAPSMTRYHLAGCHLVAGKPVSIETRADHEAASRVPCGVCQP